jgi:hypothetical protein
MTNEDRMNAPDSVAHNSVTVGPCGGSDSRDTYAMEPATLGRLPTKRTPRQEVYDIIREIAETAGTGVTVDEVLGKSRFRHIVAVRHEAIVRLAARFPWMSYPHLARLMGNRDHTTIMHALKKMGAYEPRMTPGRGLTARTYGPSIDQLFVRIGAALSASETTTTEGENT